MKTLPRQAASPQRLDIREAANAGKESTPLNAAFRDFSLTQSLRAHTSGRARSFAPERMRAPPAHPVSEYAMLNWIIPFFLMAIVASVAGFGGLAGTFDNVARFLAILFVLMFIASLVFSIVSSRRPPPPLP
jgi:uncharacterized membrane protein YtjA (UPF0391 family)